jgi:hypothetical protein
MKNLYFLLLLGITSFAQASTGDTTTIRVFDQFSMNRYGYFDSKVKLPDGAKKHQRIWLKYTLGCESNGQCEWDYTIKLHVRKRTGTLDSALKQAPYLKVNQQATDSVSYSEHPTWTTSFNTNTQQVDSTHTTPFAITLFGNEQQPLQQTDSFIGYPANFYNYVFNANGEKIDSVWIAATHSIKQKVTPYYDVFEKVIDFELGRFISPYAMSFPKTFKYDYVYDVTDYVSLFNQSDSTEFRIEYQGYSYGFTATWDMIYVEGQPAKEVIGIEPIYNGGFDYGQAISIEEKLRPTSFHVPAGTKSTKARIIITGHGMDNAENCAEFCAKRYYLKLNNTQVAEQLVWKDDCGSNAIAAQPGTWVYNRANWCPGEKVRNLDHWITPSSNTANTIDLDMEQYTANGHASYNISMVLIHYKDNSFKHDAGIEDIIAPSKNQWHSKVNPVCDNARIILKNWGSEKLTRAVIAFQISDGEVQRRYWAGSLDYEEQTEVSLPYLSWPTNVIQPIFKVWVEGVNGLASDENELNNVKHAEFDLPATLPRSFIVETRTNQVPDQNNYTITDMYGKVHYNKTFFEANTLHRDTIELGYGCYTFKFNDVGGNGIAWWAASNEGNGFVRIRQTPTTAIIKTFNADFGSFVQFSFRVQYPVGINNEANTFTNLSVYPNPANNKIFIDGLDAGQITIYDLSGKTLITTTYDKEGIDVSQLHTGLYLIGIKNMSESFFTQKFTILK